MLNNITQFLWFHTPLFYWTQSLWRDEAFSVWNAQDGIVDAIRRTSGDFNPPLYYILLNFWMRIFGRSEIALRGMSILFFFLFLLVVYKFAYAIFKKTNPARMTVLFMALNPMLLYFAFELRMYSLLCLFATLSMYFFYIRNWRWYIIATTLGLYTQPFMVFVVITQMILLLIKKRFRQIVVNAALLFVLYIPWISTLIMQFKSSGPMWMYPVNVTTITTVLGNVFMGYEGTPPNLWILTGIISIILIMVTIRLLRQNQHKEFIQFVTYWVYIPVISVLLISILKPIYVHRYVIFVTIGEVFLLSIFINLIKQSKTKNYLITIITILLITSNIVAVSFHQKINIRRTFQELPFILNSTDVIYAASPLVFYETLYYRPQNTQVFLYNPTSQVPPRYVGSVGMPENLWAKTYPIYPKRAVMVQEDGTFTITSTMEGSL